MPTCTTSRSWRSPRCASWGWWWGKSCAATKLQLGDVLLVVGPEEKLPRARTLIGRESEKDLRGVSGAVQTDRLRVTCRCVLGRQLQELAFPRRFGVTITRIQ